MGVQDMFPPREAILMAAEIAYYLCYAAQRGEWQIVPEKMEFLITELGEVCITPEGKLPKEMVQDYLETARKLAEDCDAA